jgi:uncharacterized protein (DUF1499 family)
LTVSSVFAAVPQTSPSSDKWQVVAMSETMIWSYAIDKLPIIGEKFKYKIRIDYRPGTMRTVDKKIILSKTEGVIETSCSTRMSKFVSDINFDLNGAVVEKNVISKTDVPEEAPDGSVLGSILLSICGQRKPTI